MSAVIPPTQTPELSAEESIYVQAFGIDKPEIKVQELGEEGDTWLVLNATEAQVNPAIRDWLKELGEWGNYLDQEALDTAHATHCDDWYWEPVDSDRPDDDASLKHGPEGENHFAGWLVQL